LITSEINSHGIVSIDDLTVRLETSRSTICRDLYDLEVENVLKRTRGGAVANKSRTSYEPPFDIRKDFFLEEKQRIAEAASKLIQKNETLLLDGGTTVFELSKVLRNKSDLYIATNDLNSAVVLSQNNDIELTVFGGALRKNHYSLHGYFTDNMIKQIHADKVFLGVDAVDFNIGYMNFSVEEIQTKKLMIQASSEVIVLCDHSKFEKIAFVNICHFDEVDLVITGKEVSEAILKKIEEMNIKVMVV
jgi:DeoR family transcriptional regulator, fructose operon transcriptional repressor